MAAGYRIENISGLVSRIVVLEGNQIFHAKISMSSAQILAINTTPVQMLPAPGAGMTYSFMDFQARMNFVTTPYATNVTFFLAFTGGGNNICTHSTLLTSTITRTIELIDTQGGAAGVSQYLTNTAVTASVSTGNPTAGDGSIDIYLTYRILTL